MWNSFRPFLLHPAVDRTCSLLLFQASFAYRSFAAGGVLYFFYKSCLPVVVLHSVKNFVKTGGSLLSQFSLFYIFHVLVSILSLKDKQIGSKKIQGQRKRGST